MPIQFRCTSCRQKLAISRRKAGKVVKCPACAADLQVPTLEEAEATGALIESPPAAAGPAEPPPEPAPSEPSAEEQFFDEVPPEIFDDLDQDDFAGEETSPQEVSAPAVSYELPFSDDAAASEQAAGHAPVSADEQEALAPSAPPVEEVATVTSRPWNEPEDEEEEDFHLARRPMDEGGLDMTPMVDVTFLLLIFFMITASFSIQKSMETEAPEPDDEGAAQMPSMDDLANDSVIVEIDENDVIYIDDAQVGSIAEVVDELQSKISSEQKREMIIQPHPLSKHGTVVQVTDAGIEVGMQRIRRVTRTSE